MILIDHVAKRFAAPAAGAGWQRKGWRIARTPQVWVQAVSDISLNAPNGQITGLLGPNGAGKTSTLRMLAGLLSPDSGRLEVDGLSVTQQRAKARQGATSRRKGHVG
jgi:sodium transport system ATP-binding protein